MHMYTPVNVGHQLTCPVWVGYPGCNSPGSATSPLTASGNTTNHPYLKEAAAHCEKLPGVWINRSPAASSLLRVGCRLQY